MGLKMKLQKIEDSKKNENKDTSKVYWIEQAYSKDAKYASAKVYSK